MDSIKIKIIIIGAIVLMITGIIGFVKVSTDYIVSKSWEQAK